jgi:putative acetyltransferase
MQLSPYKRSDKAEIEQLFTKVFTDSEGTSQGALIGNLVSDLVDSTENSDIFGYVASEDGQIIACIFFTRMTFDAPVEVFILSPVAVHTAHQGKGIGQKLINYGIGQLQVMAVDLVFTYGDPDFYSKTGFEGITQDMARAPFELSQAEGWLCQSLHEGSDIGHLPGIPRCVKALDRPELW